MGLETGTYISDLVATNPVGATDDRATADDHLRLIKAVLQNTFPTANSAINISAFIKTLLDDPNAATARATLGLGTAALATIGTSGDTVPKNNTANTFSAAQSINTGASSASHNLNSNNGFSAITRYLSGGVLRWIVGKDTTTNFIINRYTSAGVYADTPFTIDEATGVVTIGTAMLGATSFSSSANAKTSRENMGTLGDNQTWQDVLASRAFGSSYTPSTTRPTMVSLTWASGAGTAGIAVTVGGVTISDQFSTAGHQITVSFIVPANTAYSVVSSAGSPTKVVWAELK